MSETLLKIENVKKAFQATQALGGVTFDVKPGEVHILLGENGAGKSTLMKILSGYHSPDQGEVYWDDRSVNIKNPQYSQKLGIGMVYQELSLFPELSVHENIYLGRQPRRKNGLFVDWKREVQETQRVLEALGVEVDVQARVAELDLGIRQLIEIGRAISMNAKLIILDEPTSALTDKEVSGLFAAIRRLKENGISFIYITHRLDEVSMIGDRVTIMRDGLTVASYDSVAEISQDDLVRLMVGRTLDEKFPKESHLKDKPILEVENLTDGKTLKPLSFRLHEGEVLGIAGLVGSGRTELVETIFGLRKRARGTIRLDGETYVPRNPQSAIKRGFGFITKDRKDGLLLHMPVYQNTTVSTRTDFSVFGFRRKALEKAATQQFIEALRVDTPSVDAALGNLSGGNQQKVALAKWLCNKTRVFIMDEPTRGIDVGAKVEVYKLINEITKQGGSVLLISSEMPELLGISDRILVMCKGEIVDDLHVKECTQEKILQKASGGV